MRTTMTRLTLALLAAGGTIVCSLACGSGPRKSSEPLSLPDHISGKTRDVFRLRCAPCHGVHGRGDGASAWHLRPKPADFSLESWQRETTDAQIERAIIEGGTAVGLSSVMPAHPDLYGKGQLVELRLLMRSFAQAKRAVVVQPETPSEEPSAEEGADPTHVEAPSEEPPAPEEADPVQVEAPSEKLPTPGGAGPKDVARRNHLAKARKVFGARCAPCHGVRGRSDGLASKQLQPRPPNFSLASWQSKATDEHIMQVVAKGGLSLGLSATMPPHPDIAGGLLRSLVQLIRSFSAVQPASKQNPEDKR